MMDLVKNIQAYLFGKNKFYAYKIKLKLKQSTVSNVYK